MVDRTEVENPFPPNKRKRPMRWTKPRLKAVALLIKLGDDFRAVADKVGIKDVKTVRLWMNEPEFYARVMDGRQEIINHQTKKGIRLKTNRLDALQKRWDALNQIIEARAAMENRDHIPGWSTGLMMEKSTGQGRMYLPDHRTLIELREIEKQAAIELNQWNEQSTLDINFNAKVDGNVEALIETLYGKRDAEPLPEYVDALQLPPGPDDLDLDSEEIIDVESDE